MGADTVCLVAEGDRGLDSRLSAETGGALLSSVFLVRTRPCGQHCVDSIGLGPARHRDAWLRLQLAKKADRTFFWIEETCSAFDLTVAEALTFDFAAGLRFIEGRREGVLSSRAVRAIAVAPRRCADTATGVLAFLADEGRGALLWKGLTLKQAVRRHANRVAYVRRSKPALGQSAIDPRPSSARHDATASSSGAAGGGV